MQIFLIIIHVIACLFLIAVILLQAGRGGGLSDIAGGSQAQSILGTETNTFMKRLTEIFAIVFIVTSLSLGIISTHKGKSLIEQRRMAQNLGKKFPLPVQSSASEVAVKESSPGPVAVAPIAKAESKPVAVPAAPAAPVSAAPAAKASPEGNAK